MAVQTFGFAGTGTFYATAGIEIRSADQGLKARALLPDRFLRPSWNPGRSWEAKPVLPPVLSSQVLPKSPVPPSLPERFLRPRWDPNRAETFVPKLTIPVILPKDPVPPLLPDRPIRTRWEPFRFAAPMTVTFALATRAVTVSGPSQVFVSQSFTVLIAVSNPTDQAVVLNSVFPYFVGTEFEPGQFGQPYPQGPASWASLGIRLLPTGAISIPSFGTASFVCPVVIYGPGAYVISADAFEGPADARIVGSPMNITAVRIG